MSHPGLRLIGLALIAAVLGCVAPGTSEIAAPRSPEDWNALVAEVRLFQHRIGFEPTRNFRRFAPDHPTFPFCGYVSRAYLPYSYQDPAIQWLNVESEAECRTHERNADVTFGETEAVGESAAPVTPSMMAAPLNRLLYLVIHEDCHEQFELPYGIEEALCNVIAYSAMNAFGDDKYRAKPLERHAIQRYVREGADNARKTVALYARLSGLYERHDRAGLPLPALLRERERIFRQAERHLAWPRGSMNNVWIANSMTYSRHYPLLERVFTTLDHDLLRMIAFFRTVDAAKPSAAAVMAKHELKSEETVAFVRAYETALVELIESRIQPQP
jgi:hypothetical protein